MFQSYSFYNRHLYITYNHCKQIHNYIPQPPTKPQKAGKLNSGICHKYIQIVFLPMNFNNLTFCNLPVLPTSQKQTSDIIAPYARKWN